MERPVLQKQYKIISTPETLQGLVKMLADRDFRQERGRLRNLNGVEAYISQYDNDLILTLTVGPHHYGIRLDYLEDLERRITEAGIKIKPVQQLDYPYNQYDWSSPRGKALLAGSPR